ncbi:protein GRINL1A [Anomaloglossus baeobatrachus]|uniref:protein GRINL1A n=1 Tax=Anomaloglossus baeobatrachus TaxID=238106 RepID=UPI003F503529
MAAPVDGGGAAGGELRGRSSRELAEILERQEKLLSNKKFIAKLPDRGKKISEYAEKVRAAIAEQSRRKKNTDLLSAFKVQFQEQQCNMKENAETSGERKEKVTGLSPLSVTLGTEDASSHAMVNDAKPAHGLDTQRSPASDMIHEETCNNDCHTREDSADVLANSLKMIAIKESGEKVTSSYPGTSGAQKSHYVEITEKRSMSPVQRRGRFRTNRLPSDSNSSTPDQSPGDKALTMSAEQRKLHDRKHLDDITAARLPPLHHSPAQLLPLEESLALQIQQKNIYEEKQAKLAAQKLFEKLNIKMGPFNAEGDSYMKYRDHRDEDKFGAE